MIENDKDIRAFLPLISKNFKVIDFFAVDETESQLLPKILPNTESYHVDVDLGTNCEKSKMNFETNNE